MFDFCESHLPLLRISMIEYFVFFVTNYMPAEYSMLKTVFSLNCKIDELFLHFKLAVDIFRQTSFHTNALDWALVLQNAVFACEKCNRISKSKTKCLRKANKLLNTNMSIVSQRIILKAMNLPVSSDVLILRHLDQSLSSAELKQVQMVHARVEITHLPENLKRLQIRSLLEIMQTRSLYALSPLYLHLCLYCLQQSTYKINKVRMCGINGITCGLCRSNKCMIKINLLGKIVSVNNKLYYYCTFCHQAHEWKGLGTEFTTCPHKHKKTQSPLTEIRQCFMCSRTVNLNSLDCLDEYLGVNVSVMLCSRHMPPQHALHTIYNYETLRASQQFKRAKFF